MAASRIKGIIVEIGGDVTGLEKALKSVNSTIKTTQSELKDIERLLKLDPSNTELLSQKQEKLKEAISTTKEKLDTLNTAQEQAKQQMENTYDVSLVSCEGYDDRQVETALRAVLEPIHGLDFVYPGMTVGVKVNLVTAMKPENAATCRSGRADRAGNTKINRGACIHCFCCQEFCPKGAIQVSRHAIMRLFGKRRDPSKA